MARVRGLFSRDSAERELADELRFHLDMQMEDNLRAGMEPAEAQGDARRRLGGVESVKERYRETFGFSSVASLLQDMRYAWRTLARNPGLTAAALITISVAIGINATVFTLTNAVLFRGFRLVAGNERIVYIRASGPGRSRFPSYPDFEAWRSRTKAFADMAACRALRIAINDQMGFSESYEAEQVSANSFRLLGVHPLAGRDFKGADGLPGAAPVAILSYDLWERRYGKDPSMIGRGVRMNGLLTTVIGVMPEGFAFPRSQDIWMPLAATPELRKREPNLHFVFGRLAYGATIKGARAEIESISRVLASEYPLTNKGIAPVLQNFNEFFAGDRTIIYLSLWGAAAMVLLIACANLANLMLARATGRFREVSVRMALGAGRWRIVRQLLVESVTLSGIGGLAGLGIAQAGVRAWQSMTPAPGDSTFENIFDYGMDYRVLGYLFAISIGSGLLFGLAPALRLTKLDIGGALKDGGRGTTSGGRSRYLASFLTIGEVALAVVLIAGAGVMIRSVLNIYMANAGVRTDNILTGLVQLPGDGYAGGEARISFFQRLEARLGEIPGVESVATADWVPTWGATSLPYEFAGAAGTADGEGAPGSGVRIPTLVISPDYFQTLGAAVLSGREFIERDGIAGPPVAIVNERFAGRYWPGKNPLLQHLRLRAGMAPDGWLTVVGVVSNIAQTDFTRQEFDPLVYLPYPERPAGFMNVMVRSRVPPASLSAAFRREVYGLGSNLPIFGPYTMAERIQANYWSKGLYGIVFLIFALIALLLASVGIYAATSHRAGRRMQETGVRMALGATRRNILGLLFRQGMLAPTIGMCAGLAASLGVNRILRSMLVRVSPGDPVTLWIAAATLLLSAMLGCLIPALRAVRVNPVVALRHD